MALVAIYDSGVGGLSIYQNVVAECPEHDYLFLSDNQAFPYGTKTEDELLERAQAVVRRLDEHFSIDVLIVACNTASTIVLPYLRAEFDFQVIGVVPAIKPAAEYSVSKNIGLLATPATAKRPYTDQLIDEFASDCEVTRIGSLELVEMAEDKLYRREFDESFIATILKPIIDDKSIDVLVLACTHFPLLKAEISAQFKRFDRELLLLDSGQAIANRLLSLCQTHTIPKTQDPTRLAVVTLLEPEYDFVSQLQDMGFDKLQHLPI